jgi:hypothetical protein
VKSGASKKIFLSETAVEAIVSILNYSKRSEFIKILLVHFVHVDPYIFLRKSFFMCFTFFYGIWTMEDVEYDPVLVSL